MTDLMATQKRAHSGPGDNVAPVSSHRLARGLAVVALLSLIAAHVPVAVEHLIEVPYLGVAFYAFVLASAALLGSLLDRSRTFVWVCTAVGSIGALGVYVLSRTLGLPGASDDIGDWSNRFGFISVVSELALIIIAVSVLIRDARHH
jgi:hypothetical protein